MAYAGAQVADIPTLADYVARWLQGLRDLVSQVPGDRPGDERVVCKRCEGRLWVSVIDVERLFEAIALVGLLEVEIEYGQQRSRQCVLRMSGEHLGEDDSTVGAVYRAAANLVAALLEKGVLKDIPLDTMGR